MFAPKIVFALTSAIPKLSLRKSYREVSVHGLHVVSMVVFTTRAVAAAFIFLNFNMIR